MIRNMLQRAVGFFRSETCIDNWASRTNARSSNLPPLNEEENEFAVESIFQVPDYLKSCNIKAYHPQIVSFGPYHHGDNQLKAMEAQKDRILLRFVNSHLRPMEDYVNRLRTEVQMLMKCYQHLDGVWQNEDRFLRLMIVDGCFMLEILQGGRGRYADNDPIFGEYGESTVIPRIKKDMLMVENQIPVSVLKGIFEVATWSPPADSDTTINELIVTFFAPNLPSVHLPPSLHVLDVVRKRLLQHSDRPPTPIQAEDSDENINHCIVELRDADIRFQTVAIENNKHCLQYTKFKEGVLSLPLMVVDGNFESLFLNLMAFEQVHGPSGYEVNAFISLLTSLIRSEKDVQCLQSEKIIDNVVGSEKEVARIFEEFAKFETVNKSNSRSYVVRRQLNDHFREIIRRRQQRLYRWYKSLVDEHFVDPWTITKVLAAAIALAATVVSAVYAVKRYFKHRM